VETPIRSRFAYNSIVSSLRNAVIAKESIPREWYSVSVVESYNLLNCCTGRSRPVLLPYTL